eukprot:757096-Hanusia_phi.AAC.4
MQIWYIPAGYKASKLMLATVASREAIFIVDPWKLLGLLAVCMPQSKSEEERKIEEIFRGWGRTTATVPSRWGDTITPLPSLPGYMSSPFTSIPSSNDWILKDTPVPST